MRLGFANRIVRQHVSTTQAFHVYAIGGYQRSLNCTRLGDPAGDPRIPYDGRGWRPCSSRSSESMTSMSRTPASVADCSRPAQFTFPRLGPAVSAVASRLTWPNATNPSSRHTGWEPTVGLVMNAGRTAIALRAGAGMFVLVGCGAFAGGVSQSGAPTPTTATSALSSETQPPPHDSGGPTGGGGALPVRPIMGCYLGLNCGCIRGITCPGTIPHHHHPAPTDGQPHDARGGAPGGG